ncbi:MAG: GCAxxG family protein [Bacteroidetes bacterium]|jgi:C_GCAxxG_C_C family probable redox protein|nr:GCAxxG family protein [Bacteroidota bacterium]
MESPEERAVRYFNSGYNCAEAVLKAVADEVGTGIEDPQRFATAFGGGIAKQGHTCGCLSGAAMAIGLLAGRTAPDDAAGKERVYAAVTRLFEKFKMRAGAVDCRDITGLTFDQATHHTVCCPLVGFAARAAYEEILGMRAGTG